tara:strand:- start:70 stop:480 length:411 start_codon:yes stop_codon:yes gene_type:complete
MKLLNDENIQKGFANAYNYPNEIIAKNMKSIIYDLEILDINIETDGSVAMSWQMIETMGEQGIIDSLDRISKRLVVIDKVISSHDDDYHWWRFNAFMVALNDYLNLGLTISDRPYEIERQRINSAYDMGKFLFNNK